LTFLHTAQRANARTTRVFDENLLKRTNIIAGTKPSKCTPNVTPIEDKTRGT
jgi:hypothetical protein